MNHCLLCDAVIEGSDHFNELFSFVPLTAPCLCPYCLEQFTFLDSSNRCPCCYGELPCHDCICWKSYALQHRAIFSYNDIAKQWLKQYKLIGDYRLRHSFDFILYDALIRDLRNGWVLVPIPLDEAKYQKRGFNQVTGLLQSAKLPYMDVLKKSPLTKAQGLKTRDERLQTPQPFFIDPTFSSCINKIIIIDDIYTTGRTITHAYDCLATISQEIKSFSLFR